MQVDILTPTILPPTGPPRSPGVHVSRVIRAIAVLNKTLKPEYLESLDLVDRQSGEWWNTLDQPTQVRMLMGLAWEDTYIRTQLPEVVHQPGEMCVEGVYMTHDGEGLETVLSERGENLVVALHEVKLTYKSWNTVKNLTAQWMWLAQVKAYCRGLGTRLAYIHVLCVAGDYSYPLMPVVRIFRITFTEDEIAENWDIITSFVRHQERLKIEDMLRDIE